MMNSFLISNSNAKGPGFGLFSLTHFVVLFLLAVLSAFIIRHYLHIPPSQRKTIQCTLAIFILLLEGIKDLMLWLTGQFTMGDWPFQLCGMGIFIVAYDAWRSDQTSRTLLYSLTLPGALAALLTPDWVTNSLFNLFVGQSFLIHALLVTYVLMRLIAKEYTPQWQQLWRSALFLLIVAPHAHLFNQLWEQNFFYIETPVPGSPLEPIALIFGPFYLLGMILLVVLAWALMYTPWMIWGNKKSLPTL